MAFPTVAGTATTQQTSDLTSHNVNLPASIASGDLLVMFFANDGASTASAAGWPSVVEGTNQGTSAVRTTVLSRIADGSEGATVTVTTTGAERSAAIVYKITGHDSGQAPEGVLSGSPNLGDTALDAAELTPTGGSKDYLWLWGVGADTGDQALSAFPANYGNTGTVDMTSFASGGVTLFYARRTNAAANEDPAAATMTTSEQWAAALVAVHPSAGGVAASILKQMLIHHGG